MVTNLFWKTKNKTKNLLETPFGSEEEFEKMIFGTRELFQDIFLIKRQIRGGKKSGIPDMIGVDNEGNICIIEMKNVSVDSSIIPQVLDYAFWAEQNPDSIKSLWLECKDKPEDISIEWDNFQVRIIIIAPNIHKSTLDITNKINYPVDLIEIKRQVEGDNQILLVNKLETETKTKYATTRGLEEYNEEFYMKERNKNSVKEFMRYADEVYGIVKKQGWSLERKFNKYYCGFKAGFFNAFGIEWVGSKTFAFFFKLGEREAKKIPIKMTKYSDQWKQAVYYIDPDKTKTKDFLPLFKKAYEKISGK